MLVLLIVVVIVWGILCHICRGEWEVRRQEARKWRKEAILSEAEGAVMDFLDYGRDVSLATKGKYRGTISVRVHRAEHGGESKVYVSMYDTGNLSQLSEERLEKYQLVGFVKKYGYYYEQERDAIVYQTSVSLALERGEALELTRCISRRIQNHPLAIIKTDSMIYTRGIGQKEGNSR